MPAAMARKKEKRMAAPMVKETAVSFVRKTTLEKKTCPQCGKEFTGAKVSRYCSRVCRNQNYYERNAEQYRQDRVDRYHQEKKQTTTKKPRAKRIEFLSER